jgi:hypothetical protein
MTHDYAATRRQVAIGQYNGSAEIIAAVPARAGGPFYTVTAEKRDHRGRPSEYVTWDVRTDQPGYYWGHYFPVRDGEDAADVKREALADMSRRAGIA